MQKNLNTLLDSTYQHKKILLLKIFFKIITLSYLKKKDYDVDYKKIYKKYGHQNLYIAKLNQIKIKNAEIYK